MNALNQNCINWLLSSDHPSIRYLAKTKLLKEKPTGTDITALTAAGSPIDRIMNEIKDGIYWIHEPRFYSPKYVSSHWSLLMLHEYACPAAYSHVKDACLHLLNKSFLNWLTPIQEKHKCDHELSCFFGNVVRYAYAFELGDHPHAQAMLQFLSESKEGRAWCCIHNQNMPCLWGAVRTLYAYAMIPENDRSPQIRSSLQSGLDMVLNCAEMLTGASRSPSPKEHTLWGKISFPLYYQTDRLFTLRILQELGQLQHEKLLPVLHWLQEIRRKDGTWRGSNPYKSRSWPFGMESENTNQWVSLFALSILADAGIERL